MRMSNYEIHRFTARMKKGCISINMNSLIEETIVIDGNGDKR